MQLGVLLWKWLSPHTHTKHMLVVASGFVLGEGVWSIVAISLKSLIKQ